MDWTFSNTLKLLAQLQVISQNIYQYTLTSTVPDLCGLVVRVPGYRTEMYCVSCEVRTEFIYVM
jgi:hypothetical protein